MTRRDRWHSETVAGVDTAVSGGHASRADLDRIAVAWRDWGRSEDAWFTTVHGEILCRV
jgi:hypothetical protein